MDIKRLAKKYQDYNVELRREFHSYPEISGNEVTTTARIIRELETLGIPYQRPLKTGVIGIIAGKLPGKTVALRADIDALPLQEQTGCDFRSRTDGVMHACAHDGHTSSLLTAAKILTETKSHWNGTIKLIFQPSEEKGPSGAEALIAAGVMDDVDGILGIHIWNDIDLGRISVEAGVRMAASARVKIRVTGKGGHGALPHLGVDSLVAASAIVMNLQTIASRELNALDPAIITIGILRSGTEFNVLAQEAYMEGTIKFFNAELSEVLRAKITRIVENTARAYGAEASVEYIAGGGMPLVNNAAMSSLARRSVEKLYGPEALVLFEKVPTSDDFSRYTRQAPAVYAFVGSRNTAALAYYPHHHPRFAIDEDALGIAAGLYAQFALDFLAGE